MQAQRGEWERLGARVRLQEIEQERRVILSRFPDLLKTAGVKAKGPGGSRPGRKISPAAKKRMSAGMRRYWAQRKAKAKQGQRQSA